METGGDWLYSGCKFVNSIFKGRRRNALAARASFIRKMNTFPIHQNLNTSFVNLSALVRYLRRLQFTGSVRVELSSYEAEIFFTAANKLQAREYDHIAGRISQGEHAFKRILARAREPFGHIHVYRAAPEESLEMARKPFVDDRIAADARRSTLTEADRPVDRNVIKDTGASKERKEANIAVRLAHELLGTVDESVSKAGLNFAEVFKNACALVAEEYPFLDPSSSLVIYEREKFSVRNSVDTLDLYEGLVKALDHIFERLRKEPRFTKVLIYSRHRIMLHSSKRSGLYRKLNLTGVLDKLIG